MRTSAMRAKSVKTSSVRQIRIYIDNSNVFIEGAKVDSPGRNKKALLDRSWRYSINRLVTVLRKNSKLSFANTDEVPISMHIYGSTPSSNNFWDAMRSRGVEVYTSPRCEASGKEKEVDISMAVDITYQVCSDRSDGIHTDFIIVTGDADILPAVNKVQINGFRAHIWSWVKSLSSRCREKRDRFPQQIKLYHLDRFKRRFDYHGLGSKKSFKRCNWYKYCTANVHCRFTHSEDDRAFFTQNKGRKQLIRYYPCRVRRCKHGNTCDDYHNESERICPTCDKTERKHDTIGSTTWKKTHGSG